MTRDVDIEWILDRWFEEGPTEVADRVIDGALEIIDTTQQRRVVNAPRRYPSMPTFFKLAVAAVVVAMVGVLTFVVLQPRGLPAVGTETSSPATSAVAPSPSAVAPSPTTASASPSASAAIPTGLTGNVVAIATGGGTSCLLTRPGGVKCWGYNPVGQVGDGTRENRATPVDVVGLESGASGIAAGTTSACAITSFRGVKCWGDNTSGELGNGTTVDSATPVDVSGLAGGVVAIAAGGVHVCAVTTGGAVLCWGGRFAHQLIGVLGNGTELDSNTPVAVTGLSSGVVAITAGWNHACALTSGGDVSCWGNNDHGQLGDGTTTNRVNPVGVGSLAGKVTSIAAGGNHTCAIAGGVVQCWGGNVNGDLGNGSTTNSAVPVGVVGLTAGATSIAAGIDHTCAVTIAGGVACWGRNQYGQLGDATTTERHTPVEVPGLQGEIISLAGGDAHTCALSSSGAVECWGRNASGQLGDGTTTDSKTPVVVKGL